MLRTVCIVTVTLVCVQAQAQGTPQRGPGSSAAPATPSAASAKEFPKSAAVLPTGKTENQWGPFEGRVVDAESGDAIVGAAVIVFWKKAILNPVEEHLEFYDARWAVTDTDGRFTVPRRDPPLITLGIGGAFLSCVAPGYLPYEFTPKYDPAVQDARLREGPITVRMRRWPRLTHEEQLRRSRELSADNLMSLPQQQRQELDRLMNQRRAALGLSPIRLLSGELQ